MDDVLPPVANLETLKARLSMVPPSLRKDAIQEAWVAHLEGGDPLASVSRFKESERIYKKRFAQLSTDTDGEIADPFQPVPQKSKSSAAMRRNSLRKAG